ncbi:hypothetical protein B0O99DRAFT_681586 [Bisporella sp. PMI_857]|nr:hypothetical protein B0O99DRAFT_681586 [Bisporella sp. PMI_857]
MSVQEAFRLAHTAQCKLHIAADRPDRNLRFILGHAFTLDKLRLRIAEVLGMPPPSTQHIDSWQIEEDFSDDDVIEEPPKERRVSFHSHSHNPTPSIPYERKRSPPPTKTSPSPSPPPELGEYDDEDEGLSLRRFASAADQPPRMVDDESSSDEEDELEPRSPPPLSNEELEELTRGPGNDKLASAYRGIHNCVCNAAGAPTADKVWEVPSKEGEKRLAVISIAA